MVNPLLSSDPGWNFQPMSELNPLVKVAFLKEEATVEETLAKIQKLHPLFPSTFLVLLAQEAFTPEFYEKARPNLKFMVPFNLNPQEITALIQALNDTGELCQPDENCLPQILLEQYQENVLQKLILFHRLINELALGLSFEKIKIISDDAHKIAGSGAIFGYKVLGDLARNFDLYLQNILESQAVPENFMRRCCEIERKLLLAFQKIPLPADLTP